MSALKQCRLLLHSADPLDEIVSTNGFHIGGEHFR